MLGLCDRALGLRHCPQHTFEFLVGDKGTRLPVDAYYEKLRLVVEYRERQHSEKVPFFDRKLTVSGVPRGDQRRLYDQRRREILPKYGIALVEFNYNDFPHDSRRRLLRTEADFGIVEQRFKQVMAAARVMKRG